MESKRIVLNPSSIAGGLGVVAFLLVLASIGGQLMVYLTGHDRIYGLVGLFDVNNEMNIPTGFASLLLLFAALLLAVIAIIERTRTDSSSVLYWAILSFGFLCMAGDEAFSFHEGLIAPVRELFGEANLGVFYFAWVIPYMILVLILVPLFLRFLWRLPSKTRLAFVMAGTIYIGGAIGLELVGGRFAELHGTRNLMYSMLTTLEESLEMGGVIIFIRALLVYMAGTCNDVQFWIEENPKKLQ